MFALSFFMLFFIMCFFVSQQGYFNFVIDIENTNFYTQHILYRGQLVGQSWSVHLFQVYNVIYFYNFNSCHAE